MKQAIYIHEIQLSGKDDFSKKFNYVSWLWKMATDETLPKKKQKFYADEHFSVKLNLEQGLPISFLNEYQTS